MGNPAAVAENGEAVARSAGDLDLDAFDRGIDVAGRAAAGGFFTEDVPGFQRVAQFDGDAACGDGTDQGKAKFKVRREPFVLERIARVAELLENVLPIEFDKVREHETVVQRGAPGYQLAAYTVLSRIC